MTKKMMFIFLFFFAKCFHGYKERREVGGEKIKHEEKSQNCPFLDIYICKKQHIHFLVHGHFSWSTFGLHLVKGPKALKVCFLELDYEKCDHGKMPLTWDNFMVHDLNNP